MRTSDAVVTIGLGPGFFADAAQRPVALRELPPFEGDALDPAICGGDGLVMACAPTAASAAAALERFEGEVRWRLDGFVDRRRDRAARDPLGFRDGIDNLKRGRDHDRHVWAGTGDRTWMRGGTYLVARRIRVDLPAWGELTVEEQERVIGRHKDSGVALGARQLFDGPPLAGGAIAPDAHIRLAAPRSNAGAAMLRRSYSYDEGLMFLAFARNPRRQYVPVQRRLASGDALSRFTTHVGSALFAIPPGARPGGFVGDALLGS
jgi:deferrochelatase/peroxidase EfeB